MNGYIVRELKPNDVRAVADLLQAYMQETYDMAWAGGVSGLIRDGFGARFKMLIAKATAVIHAQGGAFIKGGAVESGSGSRLYGRFAPAFGNDFILGGKAFRHLGTLPELPIRQLVRALPQKEWNFEP